MGGDYDFNSKVMMVDKVQSIEQKSSECQTVINVCKICIGAGVLSLPYAFQSGGTLFCTCVLVGVAAWNYCASTWLFECKREMGIPASVRRGASTFSTIAKEALGPWGQWATDTLLGLAFFGVLSAYLLTSGQLVAGTGLSWAPPERTAIWLCAAAITPFCCVQHLGGLAGSSAASLAALLAALAAVLAQACRAAAAAAAAAGEEEEEGGPPLPEPTLAGAGTAVGVVTFSLGITLMALPFQEAMARPRRMPRALGTGLAFTAAFYIAVAIGIVQAFRVGGRGVDQNILLALPNGSPQAIFVGLGVALCVVLSYPLTLFPLVDMVWHAFASLPSCCIKRYEALPDAVVNNTSNSEQESHIDEAISPFSGEQKPYGWRRVVLMLFLIGLTALCASAIPFLGIVISIVGNFSINLLGFVIPALCYLRICGPKLSILQKLLPSSLLVLGLVNFFFCTSCTLVQLMKEMKSSSS